MAPETFNLKLMLCLVLGLIPSITCPPVDPKKQPPQPQEATEDQRLADLEYRRYLEEVIAALEEDETFQKRLSEAHEEGNKELGLEYEKYLREVFTTLEEDEKFREKIQNYQGAEDISKHLDLVHHSIRTKLDEIKRREVDRIKTLVREKAKMQKGEKVDWEAIMPATDHLNVRNPHGFEVKDLDVLIKQATKDLDDLDKKRRDDFKHYEMKKEHDRRAKLKELDEQAKKKAEEEYEAQKKKHKDHPKVHEPGSKAQLEEVWEKEDHLDKRDFDGKTFFKLHDKNGDGFLSTDEVEALFEQELAKVYSMDLPEDDLNEKFEEMNRMREKVIEEFDKDKDDFISLNEFLAGTRDPEFLKDEGWKGIEDEDQFTDEELAEYEDELREREGEHQPDTKPQEPSHIDKQEPAVGVVQMDQNAAVKKDDHPKM